MILSMARQSVLGELQSLGVHPASIEIFTNKAEIIPLKLVNIRTPAANIIKQEMLAAGGDCAIPAGCVVCKTERVDAILLGTRKHYKRLLVKLRAMDYFGLTALADELAVMLDTQTPSTLLADGRRITYEKTRVMGIINVTPDSFFTPSRAEEDLLLRAERMLADGADILDLGGESTRPGSAPVGAVQEQERVLPAVAALRKAFGQAIISVDTYRAETARLALAEGADIINDITALTGDAAMQPLVCRTKTPVVLMHMRGTPADMQNKCQYDNVVDEVAAYLFERMRTLQAEGFAKDKVILDPGIGFAKNTQQNLLLMQGLKALTGHGAPVLLAASRKKVVGDVLGELAAEERLDGTMATTCQAVFAGANMVRVHDVKENVRIIRMLEAILWAQRT